MNGRDKILTEKGLIHDSHLPICETSLRPPSPHRGRKQTFSCAARAWPIYVVGLCLWKYWLYVKLIHPTSILVWLTVTCYTVSIPQYYTTQNNSSKACDTFDEGFTCSTDKSQSWGQYSPWFSVPSDISAAVPETCKVTFANVLSRHGARFPTINKTAQYSLLFARVKLTAKHYNEKFAFMKQYKFNLGADLLTDFGRQELINSGKHFYVRYSHLIAEHEPFVRASKQNRVVESAQKWLQGIAESTESDPKKINLQIPEGKGNNTLDHDNCHAFTDLKQLTSIASKAQKEFAAKFVPPIKERVNKALGTHLESSSIIALMDMCPYETVADKEGKLSAFCDAFTKEEWKAYDYYQTIGKWYGYSVGHPLGPTQGVGYVNELIARLTEKPVKDHTNTNRTLDSNPETFPLDSKVYADFSHDNDISSVLAALGLYNATKNLSNTTVMDTNKTHFSASWTVPFAARMYVEKLKCDGQDEEYVRILVNDRVQPMEFCGGDDHGRCTLSKFVESQSFSRNGGLWNKC